MIQSPLIEEIPNGACAVPRLSIAPMMERTDRHYRYFARQLTRRALLYTEMITANAIIHGDRDRLLQFHPDEHPISLQLGGDNAEELAKSVRIGEQYDYDEFNLNVGCPSDRVQHGAFGACLMARPKQVAGIVKAMQAETDRPVTVKHRIGIDGRESYGEMAEFVHTVSEAGCTRFTVHARIAVLGGLSPKENRLIPPLRYEDVYRLKQDFPHLFIEINGHIDSVAAARAHLARLDSAMIGRAAYEDPYLLASVDRDIFGEAEVGPTRREVVAAMADYMDAMEDEGTHPRSVTRHMLGLFAGKHGARHWKRSLSGKIPDGITGRELLSRAISEIPPYVLDEVPHACAA